MTAMTRYAIWTVAILTALVSAASWTYRYIDDHTPAEQLLFYVITPAAFWLLFCGPLLMLRLERRALRILGVVLLIPVAALWVLSVLVGIYGLKIH